MLMANLKTYPTYREDEHPIPFFEGEWGLDSCLRRNDGEKNEEDNALLSRLCKRDSADAQARFEENRFLLPISEDGPAGCHGLFSRFDILSSWSASLSE